MLGADGDYDGVGGRIETFKISFKHEDQAYAIL